MADPAPRRRARARRDEAPDDDASPPPPPPRRSATNRGLVVAAIAAVAFAGAAKLLRIANDEQRADDALMPLPVDSADCDRWVRRQTDAFTRTLVPDGGAGAFERMLIDDSARGARNQCVGALLGHRIPKEAYRCLSEETDYGRLLRCGEEARKGAR